MLCVEEWVLWVWTILPVSHWWEGGWQPWLVYVPVPEFVHLLDMYVLLIESLIIVPYRCLQCILVALMVHILFKGLPLNLNNGYCLCCEVCACYIHFL